MSLISEAWSGKAIWAKGQSYPDFFPDSRFRFGWVMSHLSLFSVTKKCDASHLLHFWEECDALSHENVFLLNLLRFVSHPSRKTSHFGPTCTKLFWTGRNVTIQLGLKHIFLFPSQICHLSRKREARRPFGLRPTLRQILRPTLNRGANHLVQQA